MDSYSSRGDPLVSIVTWFLLVVSAFAVLGRLLTKWAVAHRMSSDDALVILSLVNLARDISHLRTCRLTLLGLFCRIRSSSIGASSQWLGNDIAIR